MKIVKVRKQGDSKIIAVTGLAEIGEHYKAEKTDSRTIKLTKVE